MMITAKRQVAWLDKNQEQYAMGRLHEELGYRLFRDMERGKVYLVRIER